MLAWLIEISQYYLIYRPRTAIKAQTLADFIIECSFSTVEKEQNEMILASEEEKMESRLQHEFIWNLFIDEASIYVGSGAGILLKRPDRFKVCYALRFGFPTSNNIAEYEALLNGMQIALEMGSSNLSINNNSQLVLNEVKRVYQAKDPVMQRYLGRVQTL